jgi:Tfp pilus assembly protein PilF
MQDINALYDEADRLKDEGQYEQAIDKLQQIVQSDPSHVLSHLALAVLYGKVGQPERAVEHGVKACELDPEDPFTFTAMSVTYQRAWQATQNPDYIHLAEQARDRAHVLQARM